MQIQRNQRRPIVLTRRVSIFSTNSRDIYFQGVCMYQLSTRFCKPPFCWNPDAPETQCKKQCSSPGSDKAKMRHMERICKEEVNTVSIKTIRFLDLKRLHPFYADSYPIDFKAVLLVRDPRSMYHSR